MRKPSEHGLGQLLHPVDPDDDSRDWIAETWAHIIRTHHGLTAPEPDWLDRPAVARTAITSPRLQRQFRTLNRDKPYDEQIKPFNFLLVAFVDLLERPADDDHVVLIAPYETDRDRWLTMPWTNRYTGRVYHLTLEPSGGRERHGIVTPKTYRDILNSFLAHEEAKSLAPNRRPCEPLTSGLLLRRPVVAQVITHVGKEANQLESALVGLVADQDEILNNYEDSERVYFRDHVARVLRDTFGIRGTARMLGLRPATVHDVLVGQAYPREQTRARYAALAAKLSPPPAE